ncbi:MAG: ABC transporter permease, partial [Clostridia bacterium]|nr:ABC transporter permease [Clostridia bacterium]
VVGVTKAGSLLFQNIAQMIPGMVYIPSPTWWQLTGRTDFDQLAVRLTAKADPAVEAMRIERALSQVSGESGFRAEDLSAQKDKLTGLMDIVTAILTAVSAISLLVSGLSIMTVMMVSVGERTREIGVKKALGATDGRIRREFLAEALLLSFGGGSLGVLLGLLIGQLGLSVSGVTLSVSPSLVWLVLFAAGIGVAFGVYPAHKAAHLDPVDALRCE